MIKTLTCIKCNKKEQYEFNRKPRYICSKCQTQNARLQTKKWKDNNKEHLKQYHKQYHAKKVK